MTAPMDMEGPAAPPRSNGELVFAEPWESRAFGMAVTLSEAGVFTWPQFQAALIARIARWRGDTDRGRALELLPPLAGRAGGCAGRPRRRAGRRRHRASPGAGPTAHWPRPPALSPN